MKFGWKMRVGLVVSAVWLCLAFLVADDHRRTSEFLGLGFLPLLVIWGIAWAVAGWRTQRPAKTAASEEAVLEARRKRRLRIRIVVTVVVVLGVGLWAAAWQFRSVKNVTASGAISSWFGEWLVYGLFAYALFRASAKIPPGLPAVLAALLVVGGVNYKAYTSIAEDRQIVASLSKAAPLINKIQSDAPVSDQEVRDAQVGVFEPLMLAQATYSREVIAIAGTYTITINGLQLELLLTPISLASPSIRAQTRAKLKVWEHATAEYKSQLESATARGKLGIQAALSQMPVAMAGSTSKGFEQSSAQLTAYVTALVNSEKEASDTITGILNLMDADPGGYTVEKGPPVNLLFRDETTLAEYRQLMNAVMAASQHEGEAKARLVKAQADRIDQLTDFLKR